jgi:hypothetical protein
MEHMMTRSSRIQQADESWLDDYPAKYRDVLRAFGRPPKSDPVAADHNDAMIAIADLLDGVPIGDAADLEFEDVDKFDSSDQH